MFLRLGVIGLLFFSKISHQNRSNLISFVTNLISVQNYPIKISAHICWDQENLQKLSKMLIHERHTTIKRKEKLEHHLPHQHVFLMDLDCPNSNKTLKEAERMKLFKHPFKWIFFGNSDNLNKYYFGVDSHVYVIQKNFDSFRLKTVYKYSPNGTFVENYLPSWFPKGNSSYSLLTTQNRTNLMGTTIKISYVITNLDSLNHLWDYRDTHVDAISKLNFLLVHNLMDFLNASREFIMQRTWGYKNTTTGLYSGMAGDLQNGIADLGGTPLFFTIDRIDIIDYIAATTPTYMKFIFRAPPLSYVTNVFTLPFDANVWHYSFLMVAVVIVCLYIIVIWEWKDPTFREKYVEEKATALKPNLFDVIMLEIGAISQQGTDVEPKSIAGRIATIFTFLTLMFMYTSYSANVVALLQSTTDSIKTLEDLLNSRIKLGVEDIVYAHYYFENAQEPVRRAIYQQKVAPKGQKPNFMTAEEGIKRVQEGFFAFHIELSTGYKIVGEIFQESEKCGLKEIEYVNLIEPWLSMQKNSPYKEVMKVGMRKLHESGIQKRERAKIYTGKPACHGKGSNFGSVGMIDCYSAFLIFGAGVACAILLLLCETIVKRYATRYNCLSKFTVSTYISIIAVGKSTCFIMANLEDYNFTKEGKYLIIKIAWACIYLLFIFITITAIVTLSKQFLENPTITSLESAYFPVTEVPFPGVAICNMNKISSKRAQLFAKEIENATGLHMKEITSVIRILGRLYDFDYHASERESLEKLQVVFEKTNIDIISTMQRLSTQCEDYLLQCHWKGNPVNCKEIFILRLTYDGYCCSFNYIKETTRFERDAGSKREPLRGVDGITKGLSVIIENDVEDYQYVPLVSSGVVIQVFNPSAYPDKSSGGVSEIIAATGTENFIEVIPTTVRTVSEVKKYPLSKRKCLFNKEKPTKFKGAYSQSDCNMDCKISSTLALCQCIPFLIPRSTNETVCDLTNLACLNRYKNKWSSMYPEKDELGILQRERHDSLRCTEICYPSCDGTSYEVRTDTAPVSISSADSSHKMNYTIVHLYYSNRFSKLFKQDVVFYWFEILSNFGGTFGLVVGMSLISVSECLIFATQKLLKLRLSEQYESSFD